MNYRFLGGLRLSAAACALVGACASATPPVMPANTPPGRLGHSMVYDEANHRVLMFGGSVLSNTFFGDLWSWNGREWRLLASSGPAPRENAVMVYDRARARVVLHGGEGRESNAPKQFADTWEWDGTQWAQRVSSNTPGARHHAVAAYDEVRNRVVLFGGFTPAGTPSTETWEWDGTTWTNRGTDAPTNRNPVAAVFDPSLPAVVALLADFSSFDSRGWADAALWQWNGSAWSKVTGSDVKLPAPSPMAGAGASGGLMVYHGGGAGGLPATLRWDGSAWVAVQGAGPSARLGPAAAYDASRGLLVLFGGLSLTPERVLSDTWEWSNTTGWKTVP